jgi:hypothetical protein
MDSQDRKTHITILNTIIEFKNNQIKEHKELVEEIERAINKESIAYKNVKNLLNKAFDDYNKDIVVYQERIKKLENTKLDLKKVETIEDLDNL